MVANSDETEEGLRKEAEATVRSVGETVEKCGCSGSSWDIGPTFTPLGQQRPPFMR